MKEYQDLKNTVLALEADAEKFNAGNNAAGTRLRKGLQDVKNKSQELRLRITEVKNLR